MHSEHTISVTEQSQPTAQHTCTVDSTTHREATTKHACTIDSQPPPALPQPRTASRSGGHARALGLASGRLSSAQLSSGGITIDLRTEHLAHPVMQSSLELTAVPISPSDGTELMCVSSEPEREGLTTYPRLIKACTCSRSHSPAQHQAKRFEPRSRSQPRPTHPRGVRCPARSHDQGV